MWDSNLWKRWADARSWISVIHPKKTSQTSTEQPINENTPNPKLHKWNLSQQLPNQISSIEDICTEIQLVNIPTSLLQYLTIRRTSNISTPNFPFRSTHAIKLPQIGKSNAKEKKFLKALPCSSSHYAGVQMQQATPTFQCLVAPSFTAESTTSQRAFSAESTRIELSPRWSTQWRSMNSPLTQLQLRFLIFDKLKKNGKRWIDEEQLQQRPTTAAFLHKSFFLFLVFFVCVCGKGEEREMGVFRFLNYFSSFSVKLFEFLTFID